MHQLLEAGTTFYTAAMTQLDVSFAIKRKTYDIVISVSIYIYILLYIKLYIKWPCLEIGYTPFYYRHLPGKVMIKARGF